MFTVESRLLLLIALVAGVAGAVAAASDVLVATLFAGAFLVTLLLGLAVVGRPVPPGEGGGGGGPGGPGPQPGGGGGPGPMRVAVPEFAPQSVWPLAAAVAVVATAVGLVAAPRAAAFGAAGVVGAGLGWVLQRHAQGLVAAGAPAALAGAAAVAFAGVLAAVGPQTAAAMALFATVAGLVAAFVAARPGTPASRAAWVLAGALGAAAAAGAVASAAAGRRVDPQSFAAAVALVAAAGIVVAGFVLASRPSAGAPGVLGAVLVVGVVALGLGSLIAACSGPRREAPSAGGPEKGPAVSGKAVYAANCASCHGARGEGGVGPKLAGGEAKLTFPNEADHVNWVKTGSVAMKGKRYGDPNRPGGQRGPATGAMPGFGAQLSDEEIAAVVAYERDGL